MHFVFIYVQIFEPYTTNHAYSTRYDTCTNFATPKCFQLKIFNKLENIFNSISMVIETFEDWNPENKTTINCWGWIFLMKIPLKLLWVTQKFHSTHALWRRNMRKKSQGKIKFLLLKFLLKNFYKTGRKFLLLFFWTSIENFA